ncbi:MAG TPA: helix-turn-helix transcriptional regulator [Verrucomicrobiae bacterium]|nr:helix-turn-helix transcriptional regulator [Verrucomicrobiae bacterium]
MPKQRSASQILGEAIRVERLKAGLTQEELAEKADLSLNYIGNIERAEYQITVETLAKIAKALKTNVSELTKGV